MLTRPIWSVEISFTIMLAWLDTGTHESLLQASQYIEIRSTLAKCNAANLEEIAHRMGYITKEQVHELAIIEEKRIWTRLLLRLEKRNDGTI